MSFSPFQLKPIWVKGAFGRERREKEEEEDEKERKEPKFASKPWHFSHRLGWLGVFYPDTGGEREK